MSASLRFLSHLRVGLAAAQSGRPSLGASNPYSVSVGGTTLDGQFRVLGPADVLGLDDGEVARQFPPPSSRDHEPNLFAHVELKSADLPWRLTPGGPEGGKLRPWLVLVVVDATKRLERPAGGARLPVLRVAGRELPNLAESWAWAHAQVTLDDPGAVPDAAALRALYESEPHRFVARLICPRALEARGQYRACLVPAFDVGRDVGLGLDVSAQSELGDAWSPDGDAVSLPVYHSWTFACAGRGDFEFLAERLRPRSAPAELGVASLDASAPGLGLPGVKSPLPLVGPLCAPGAVRALGAPSVEENALRAALWQVVRQGASVPIAEQQPDPIVSPPQYGAIQWGSSQAQREPPAWQQTLNANPAQRAVAGLGAELVRSRQEELAASAWDQLAEVGRLQRTLQRDALKESVNQRQRQRFASLAAGKNPAFLVLARSMQALVTSGDKTFLQRLKQDTDVPAAVASGAAVRVASRAARIRRRRSLPAPSAAGMTAACVAPDQRPDFAPRPAPGARTLVGAMQPVAAPGLVSLPGVSRPLPPGPSHPADKREGVAPTVPSFRGGASIAEDFWAASDPVPFLRARRRRLLAAASELGIGNAGPLPARLLPELSFRSAFSDALARMSPEYLLPRVGDLPNDSIVTAEVNPVFIEALLAGMNDEWAREVIWRELPADPRATSMRRFWAGDEPGDQIPPIRDWNGALGSHATPLAGRGGLALIIKGRLLERYPDAVVYALPGVWNGGERKPDLATAAESILWPSVSGEVAPGIHYFIFFGLTAAQTRGSDPSGVDPRAPGAAKPGWFFVLEEQPSAPRFGLDVAPAGAAEPITSWSELNWAQIVTAPASGEGARHLSLTPLSQRPPGANWAASAADMAWITLQMPYRVYIHGSSMLPDAAPSPAPRT